MKSVEKWTNIMCDTWLCAREKRSRNENLFVKIFHPFRRQRKTREKSSRENWFWHFSVFSCKFFVFTIFPCNFCSATKLEQKFPAGNWARIILERRQISATLDEREIFITFHQRRFLLRFFCVLELSKSFVAVELQIEAITTHTSDRFLFLLSIRMQNWRK